VRTFCNYLDDHPFKGFVEYVPAFTSISVIYNPLELNYESPYEEVKELLEEMLCHVGFSKVYEENIVNIPVCYGGEFGPDIKYVAEINNLTVEEVIKIHSEGKYLVYMIGFAPGFPYLVLLECRQGYIQ
jgi:inhibitor of KinA